MATQARTLTAVDLLREAIEAFCRRWGITELALLAPGLLDHDDPEREIGFLATFAPTAGRTLFDVVDMERELAELLGRPVALVSKRGVEQSANPTRRSEILGAAEPYYAER